MNDLNTTLEWIKDSSTWAGIDASITIISVILLIPALITYLVLKYKEGKERRRKKSILKGNHIIVCGLGSNNRVYLDSEIKDNNTNIIIIEQNKDNPYIESYISQGLGIIIGDATDEVLLDTLNLSKAKHLLVSVGKDMTNLEITTQLLNKSNNTKLYIHLEDRSLRHFHKEQGVLQGNNIKLYSYYEESSRELFEQFDIDGFDNSIINSNDDFSIAIIGNTNLSYEVISQACIMGQLPNENKLTIYCIDKDINEFRQSVELNYTQIQNVPNVELKYISFDINSKEFYEDSLWKNNLTNIIVCFENDQINLDIASNLANITYLEKIADNKLKTNIIISMFNEYSLSNIIKNNNQTFNNFYIFGNTNHICNKKYIINEQRDKRAIATNKVYKQKNPDYGKDWNKLTYFEKESNRASADHIKIKYKYLQIKSDNKAKELLAKCEHNRWNSYHFLNGYRLNETKNHSKKLHNCLIDYDSLTEEYKDYDREMISNIDDIIGLEKNAK